MLFKDIQIGDTFIIGNDPKQYEKVEYDEIYAGDDYTEFGFNSKSVFGRDLTFINDDTEVNLI